MRVRPRALLLLLPLTTGDYLLWDWSVAGSHDVLALISGMTLLPLAALSLGLLAVGTLRLVALTLRQSRTMIRSVNPARSTRSPTGRPGQGRRPAQARAASTAAQPASSERKLAA